MLGGLLFTSSYIIYFKFLFPELNNSINWFFGISPEGIGFLGMFVNFIIALTVSAFTAKPPIEVGQMVDKIRLP
jgi:cation/acetate symporter